MPQLAQHVRLRPLCLTDEHQYRQLQAELRDEGYRFGLQVDEEPSWDAYMWRMADQRQGLQLDPGEVAESPMVAVLDQTIVGAVWLRFEHCLRGNLNFAVGRPYRRHHYGGAILTRALPVFGARGIRIVTLRCETRSKQAARVIERSGGKRINPPQLERDHSTHWYALHSTGRTSIPRDTALREKIHNTHI